MTPVKAAPSPCRDPDCHDATGARSIAEPEQDGDLYYLACPECGYEFGYQRITTTADPADPAKDDGVCPVGIPDAVRRQAVPHSPPSHGVSSLPLLQIGRRP